MITRRVVASFATAAIAITIGCVAIASPAHAGTGLFYQAVDSDNDPYSGIYLRDGTSMANVRRITSRYLYYGNTVELICGTWGEAVGPNSNRRWHSVTAINGPAAGQTGWIADRYVNTPNVANQVTPGEPECGVPPRYDGSVYYSPAPPNNHASPATFTMAQSSWAPGGCNPNQAGNFPSWVAPSNQYVTTLSGWSIGRLGPVYFLQANRSRWSEIHYILLFDPGNLEQLTGGCDDDYNPGRLYTDWLKSNPNNRLVILAGVVTSADSHRGIQEAYFNYLRANGGPRDRVIVCNYGNLDHTATFTRYRDWITRAPITRGTCPDGAFGWNP